jgi:DeoR/GlpR family transcriptional regulator of sugar metabolism
MSVYKKNTRNILAAERRRLIADLTQRDGSVSIATLEEEFGISAMTARRDLAALERSGEVRRTHGGAVLPDASSHEDSFSIRLEVATGAKERLAEAYVTRLTPGQSLYLDSSTTSYFVALEIIRQGLALKIITNAVEIMRVVASAARPNLELIGLGGTLRAVSRSFVGPQTNAAIASHIAERAALSVKGITQDGTLTDPDPFEADIKRAMWRHCRQPTLLIDGTKFETTGLHVVGTTADVTEIIVADAPAARIENLRHEGANVTSI